MSLPIMNFAQNNPSRLLQSIEMSRSPAFLPSELLNTQRWCEERRGSTYKVPRTVPVMKSLPLLQASHGSRFAQLSKLSLVLKLLALHLRNSFSTSSVLLWGQSSFKSQRNAWVFTYTLFFWKMNFFHTIYSYHSFPSLISFQILPTFLLIQLHTFSLFRKRTGKLKTKTNQRDNQRNTHIS